MGHFSAMEIVSDLELAGHKFHGGTVTIGNFDGLHLGHQELLKQARVVGAPIVVISFDPHPVQVLYPERQLRRLFPREDLYEQLPKYGVNLLWMLPFSKEFAAWPAEKFLEECLWQRLRPKALVVGYDFAFGKSRSGSLEGLKAWGKTKGVEIHVVEPLKFANDIVSSRRLRELICQGRVKEARQLLGRPFYLRGSVISGAGRGAGLGSPTLNQEVVNETYPAHGVYASFTIYGNQKYPSVTNIGVNPTFGGREIKVETHVLNATLDLRGMSVDVELIDYIRPEMKFESVEDLKKQIRQDILKVNETLDLNRQTK